jgi:uncharacterized repeat protein (TIGR01451 family)
VAVVLGLLGSMPGFQANAATSAGATIFNKATLTYNGGSVSAAITVGVALLPSPPVLSSPPDPAANTTSGATEPITYSITSSANGKDTYNLTSSSVDLCTESCGTLGAPAVTFLLGSTGATTITSVVLEAVITSGDSNTSGEIIIPAGAETDNLSSGTIVSIGGSTYVVGTITAGTTANVDAAEVPTRVALSPGGNNPGTAIGDGSGGTVLIPAGTQVGEVVEFRTMIVGGTLSDGATEGTHTVTTIATSGTDNSQSQSDAVRVTVVPVLVTVTKEVANKTDPSLGPSCPAPCFGGSNDVSAKSGQTLIYRITLSVPATEPADLTGAVLTDAVPEFTTYVADSLTLNGTRASTVAPGQGGTSPGDAGVFPLQGGFSVNSPGEPGSGFAGSGTQGVIVKGSSAVVTFEVVVD